MITAKKFIALLPLIFIIACSSKGPDLDSSFQVTKEFKNYWYAGKAELNRFKLIQARYGELREGEAEMIFVTEPFLIDKQVKRESKANEQTTTVLKLNLLKKFATGIYDYSMMTSVFSALDIKKYPNALKISTTSQDWCGHTFTQLNAKNNNYKVREASYFETEGDQEFNIERGYSEDELWVKIRMNPSLLPLGKINIIPSTMSLRLRHHPTKPEKAIAELVEYKGNDFPGTNLQEYSVKYDEGRSVKIIFESKFPYLIAGWEESYKDGFGNDAKMLTSKAIRTNVLMSDYWAKHSNADKIWRDSLGVQMNLLGK